MYPSIVGARFSVWKLCVLNAVILIEIHLIALVKPFCAVLIR